MRTIPHRQVGIIHARGGERDNWGQPETPYEPPADWDSAETLAERRQWLNIAACMYGFSTLGVATGVLTFSGQCQEVSPALAYCRHLAEFGLNVGNSLFLRAALDELTEDGFLRDGRVSL